MAMLYMPETSLNGHLFHRENDEFPPKPWDFVLDLLMIYINLLTVLDLYIVYCSGSNIYLYIYTVYIYKSSFLVSQLLEVQIFTLRAGWDDFFFHPSSSQVWKNQIDIPDVCSH